MLRKKSERLQKNLAIRLNKQSHYLTISFKLPFKRKDSESTLHVTHCRMTGDVSFSSAGLHNVSFAKGCTSCSGEDFWSQKILAEIEECPSL